MRLIIRDSGGFLLTSLPSPSSSLPLLSLFSLSPISPRADFRPFFLSLLLPLQPRRLPSTSLATLSEESRSACRPSALEARRLELNISLSFPPPLFPSFLPSTADLQPFCFSSIRYRSPYGIEPSLDLQAPHRNVQSWRGFVQGQLAFFPSRLFDRSSSRAATTPSENHLY